MRTEGRREGGEIERKRNEVTVSPASSGDLKNVGS